MLLLAQSCDRFGCLPKGGGGGEEKASMNLPSEQSVPRAAQYCNFFSTPSRSSSCLCFLSSLLDCFFASLLQRDQLAKAESEMKDHTSAIFKLTMDIDALRAQFNELKKSRIEDRKVQKKERRKGWKGSARMRASVNEWIYRS